MCPECEEIETIDAFFSPKAYLSCLKNIQSLVDSGSFEFESKDCGQHFTCTAVTYRGDGCFRKGK